MSLPDAVRVQVITAAATAAGPSSEPGWAERVADNAVSLVTLASPDSPVSKRMEAVLNAKRFVATLTAVDIEESSTRGVVTLQGKPSSFNETGVEHARTERTDGNEGAAMVRKLKGLVGNRVLVYIDVQDIGQGANARKMRVLVHVDDLGPDRFAAQAQAKPASRPAPVQNDDPWGVADDSDAPPF